jgi:hypothetical protein
MNDELKRELNSEDLTKTTDPQNIELTKEEQDRVSGGGSAHATGGLFEVEDYSFDIEQTLNIGSQSKG